VFRRIGLAIVTLLIFCSGGGPAPADRAHDQTKNPAKMEAETCEDVQTFQDCHDNYPAGCTNAQFHF